MPRGRVPESLASYKGTQVSASASKEDIEGLLLKVGAKGFQWSNTLGEIETLNALLDWQDRPVAFRLSVRYTSESERKQKLRVMYWYLKTKIEAIQFGLIDLEEEFLPYLLTKTGETVSEQIKRMGTSEWLALPPPTDE